MEQKYCHMHWMFILMSGLLISCSNAPVQPPVNTGKYTPEINPHPKYFMTITGFLDPTINKHSQLKFIANYRTGNPNCKYVMNSFEGVSSDRYETSTILSNPNNNGQYLVKIPLDKYLGGLCKWHLLNIDYQLKSSKLDYLSRIAFFSDDSVNKKYDIHDKLICSEKECIRTVPSYFSTEYLLSTKSSYVFNLDVYWSSND